MSERTRAKEALRVEVNTYTGENVRKIAATAAAAEEDRILRVAAYCRVSTDDIDQLVSIEMQKNAYRDMIKANPKWKHVGTYVDDGFSGTNTEHRPAFQLMMKDAMAGKIEIFLSKWIQSHKSETALKSLEIRHFTAFATSSAALGEGRFSVLWR